MYDGISWGEHQVGLPYLNLSDNLDKNKFIQIHGGAKHA